MLLGVDEKTAAQYVREYFSLYRRPLPTRGNIQMLGAGQAYKKEMITMYLNWYLIPTICQRTNHSKDAVERNIRDFEAIRLLNPKFDNINTISLITRLSKSVVQQYIDLIQQENIIPSEQSLVSFDTILVK
jgi:translation initiation factor RLI1